MILSTILRSIFSCKRSGVLPTVFAPVLIVLFVNLAPLFAEDYSTWSHSRRIYFNTTSSGANVTGAVSNFPILIRLNSSNFNFNEAAAGGADIRFADGDNTQLHYEIERWDAANQLSEIWVLVPQVAGSSNQDFIYMYWGKGGAADSSNSGAVFDTANGFVGAWHFNENFLDATKLANNGTNFGSDDSLGMIGRARGFVASNTDYIDIPHHSKYQMSDSISFSTWCKLKTVSGYVAAISKSRDVGEHADLWLGRENTNVYVGLEGPLPTTDWVTTEAMPANTFTLLTVVYDRDSVKLYKDGVRVDAKNNIANTMELSGNTNKLCIGYSTTWGNYWNGVIDEVRISRNVYSPNWIKLSYQNQRSSNTLVEMNGISRTFTGAVSTAWNVAGNWNPVGAPRGIDTVIFSGTANSCNLTKNDTVAAIRFAGTYTGTFNFQSFELTVTGNADFRSGGAITAGTGKLYMAAPSGTTKTLTPHSSSTLPSIYCIGAGTVVVGTNGLSTAGLFLSGGIFDLGDGGLTHTAGGFSGSGTASLDFGNSTLRVSGSIDFSGLNSLTAGSGTIELTGTGIQTVTPLNATATHPGITRSGSGTFRLSGSKLKSNYFLQTGGILDLNGRNLETVGDFTILSGANTSIASAGSSCLNGRTITVGGNALLEGGSCGGGSEMNCNASATWWFEVTGTLTATNVNLDYCNASGSAGIAGNCVNGGHNTNWTFTSVKTWLGTTNSWNTATNWCPSGVPASTDTVYFNSTGIGPCVLDVDPAVASIIFTGGFTRTFTFNSKKITATNKMDFRSGGTITVTSSDWIIFNSASSTTLIPKSGVTLPQVEKSGNGTLTIVSNGYRSSGNLYLKAGGIDLGDYGAVHSVGNMTIDAGTLDFGTATLQTTGNVSFTNLTTLTAGTGTLELTGTSPQSFIPKAGQTHPGIRQNGSGGTTLNNNLSCGTVTVSSGNFDLNGYTLTASSVASTGGSLQFKTSSPLQVTGHVNLSGLSAITDDGSGVILFTGNSAQIFTPHASQTHPKITQNGTGGTSFNGSMANAGILTISQGTLSLGSGLTIGVHSVTTTGGSINFGSSTLQIKTGSANLSSLSSITAGTGTLAFTAGSGTQTLTMLNGSTVPALSHSGAGTLQLAGSTIQAEGFSQTAGTIDFNGIDFTTVNGGTFVISPVSSVANLGGRTITVAGNCQLNGQSGSVLNLNTTAASSWTLAVSGTLSANYAAIRYCNASVSPGIASNSTNSGSNVNWTFHNDWGITSSSFSTSYEVTDLRCMGGTSPNVDNMVITKLNYRSAGTGTVAMGVYTGGALNNPVGARLLTEKHNISVVAGWNEIDVDNRSWPKNTATWVVFAMGGNADIYASTSSANCGNFQSANGRWNVTSPADFDETGPLPETIGSGAFSAMWYAVHLEYNVVTGNNAPTDIALSSNTVNENQPAGTVIGILSATDPDPAKSHVYVLASGSGDSNNTSFIIRNDTLYTNAILDYEMHSSYGCRIKVDDCYGGTYSEAFSITVINANDAPIAGAGNALDLDGTDDYVDCGNKAGLNITDVITIEAWVKPNDISNLPYVVARRDGANQQYALNIWDGKVEFTTWGADPQMSSTETLPIGQWSHVAVVFNSATQSGEVYINGVAKGTDKTASAISTAVSNVYIGGRGDGSGGGTYTFDGLIDEVRIWHVVRTQAEIQNNRYKALVGNEANLVGYWRMDNSAGTLLTDYASSGSNGTLKNMTDGDWVSSESWKSRTTNDITPLTHGAGWDPDGDGITITQSVAPAKGTLSFDNGQRTVTYTPALNSEGVFSYTYQVSDGSLTDTYQMSVTVSDVTAPAVSAFSPADNSDQVAPGSNFVITFNENVQAGTGNITLYRSDNTLIEQMAVTGARVSFNGTTGVTINPNAFRKHIL